MRDGSNAIADWPILNALLNVAAGATWVSVHHGGGVGIGNSMVVVAGDRPPERPNAWSASRPIRGRASSAMSTPATQVIAAAEEHGLAVPVVRLGRPHVAADRCSRRS